MRNIISENKNNYVVVRVVGRSQNSFVKKLAKMKIRIFDIEYESDEEILIRVLKSDYQDIKIEFRDYQVQLASEYGIYKVKPFLKRNQIILMGVVFGLFLVLFLSRVIVRVDVIHSKKTLRDLVTKELEEYGIKRLTLKKDYSKLEEIKQSILDSYPDQLEWIEIEVLGMNYIVRVEERIITVPEVKPAACHVVAIKDGIITKIIAHDGEAQKRVNNAVKKGDIIISGNVMLNEEIKNTVCARGSVYAEVWYTVNVSVDLEYEEHKVTGDKRWNFMWENEYGKHSLFKGRFDHYNTSDKKIFSLFGIGIYKQMEMEYEVIPKKYSEEEAINEGIRQAVAKIELKLNANEWVISKNVLKKSVNDSKMELEIFFTVNELISETEEFVPLVEDSQEGQ